MRILAAAILVVAMSAAAASAANAPYETAWQADPATPSDWFNPANWTFGVPTTQHPINQAVIDNAGTALISSGYAAVCYLDIGGIGTGAVIQSGGALETTSNFFLGDQLGSKGTYTLLGGSFKAGAAYIGNGWGIGQFTQIGGQNTTSQLAVGHLPSSVRPTDLAAYPGGVYELIGGQLSTNDTSVGSDGRGRFVQTGGVHTVVGSLSIGGPEVAQWPLDFPPVILTPLNDLTPKLAGEQSSVINYTPGITNQFIPPPNPSEGRYELSGGQLNAKELFIGFTGQLKQTGGSATLGYLSIASGGLYEFLGGSFKVTAGVDLRGTLDLGGITTQLAFDGGLINLSRGSILNAGNTSLAVGPDSLTLFAKDTVPGAAFKQFTSAGLVHIAGSDLVIPAGQGFTGQGEIMDFVDSRGHIGTPAARSLNLMSGVFVHEGSVDLGYGSVQVGDDRSGISAGQLTARSMTVGSENVVRLGPDGGYITVPPGVFRQTGGTTTIDTLNVLNGAYELHGGVLSANFLKMGDKFYGPAWRFIFTTPSGPIVGSEYLKNASFVQTGGTASIDGTLRVGPSPYTSIVALNGDGAFCKSDASTLFPDPLKTAQFEGSGEADSVYSYHMNGGKLSTGWLTVDTLSGRSEFIQTGGDVTVRTRMSITGTNSTYAITGGSLTTPGLSVGDHGSYDSSQSATLAILSSQARITVSQCFSLGRGSTLTAVPGATVHITSAGPIPNILWPHQSNFEIWSTDPASLVGLENLTVIFEGGAGVVATFEVAGQDRGEGYGGFFDNFALGTLQIGGDEAAYLKLVDLVDNQPDWLGTEALYVKNLIIGSGSTLDLGGLNIYYLHSTIADDVTFTNGTLTVIPEPATLGLLLAGAAALRLRRRHR